MLFYVRRRGMGIGRLTWPREWLTRIHSARLVRISSQQRPDGMSRSMDPRQLNTDDRVS